MYITKQSMVFPAWQKLAVLAVLQKPSKNRNIALMGKLINLAIGVWLVSLMQLVPSVFPEGLDPRCSPLESAQEVGL